MARVSLRRYTACPGLRIHSLPKRADASVAPEDCLICCTATWGATKIVLKRAGIHRSTNCSACRVRLRPELIRARARALRLDLGLRLGLGLIASLQRRMRERGKAALELV